MINKIVRFSLWSERQRRLHQGIEEILTKIYHASKRYREKKIQYQSTDRSLRLIRIHWQGRNEIGGMNPRVAGWKNPRAYSNSEIRPREANRADQGEISARTREEARLKRDTCL